MRRYARAAVVLGLIVTFASLSWASAAHERNGLLAGEHTAMRKLVSGQPIPVGTPDGRGPLAAGLSSVPVGAAYVYGSERPDLFVTAGNFSADPGLFLYKWTGTGPNGEPVFGERRKVTEEGGHGVGTIFQTEDGVIHGLWLDGGALRHIKVTAR